MSEKIEPPKITRMEDLLDNTNKKTNPVEQETKPQPQKQMWVLSSPVCEAVSLIVVCLQQT